MEGENTDIVGDWYCSCAVNRSQRCTVPFWGCSYTIICSIVCMAVLITHLILSSANLYCPDMLL